MDRGSGFRVMYGALHFLIVVVTLVYSVTSILVGVTLRIGLGNTTFFGFLSSIIFGFIFWQFPKNIEDKIQQEISLRKMYERRNKGTKPPRKQKKRRSHPQRSPKRESTSEIDIEITSKTSDTLTIDTDGKNGSLIQKVKYYLTGTRLIKSFWMNIIFINGVYIFTFLIFWSISSFFEILYSTPWLIANIVYSVIMTIVVYIPFKVYMKVLVEDMVDAKLG